MDTPPPTPNTPPATPPPVDPLKPTSPKTVVMSKLEAQLAAERARVEAEMAMNRAEHNKFTTKKIIIIIVVTVVSLALVSILFFVLFNAFTNSRTTNTDPKNTDPTPGQVLPTIEGYRCTTTVCSKAADLGGGQILIRDTDYYVYNRGSDQAMKTTIETTDYRSFVPFSWGDILLLVLERSTGRQGLYSVSANRAVTDSYNYTGFDRDIKSANYAGMEWVEGTYILANIASETRLLDVRNGQEVVRAAVKIFATRDFIIGYEAEGQRRIYTMNGERILVADAPSTLMVYDHHLAHITGERNLDLYDIAGTKLPSNSDYYRNLRSQLQATKQNYAPALSALPSTFVIPD